MNLLHEADGGLVAQHLDLPGIWGSKFSLRRSGASAFYVPDHQGHTRQLTNAAAVTDTLGRPYACIANARREGRSMRYATARAGWIRFALAVFVVGGLVELGTTLYSWSGLMKLALSGALREVPFDRKAFDGIVADVKQGRLQWDRTGVVRLPTARRRHSKDGCVFVTERGGGAEYVLIPTWRGKATNLLGYLYVVNPSRTLQVGSKVRVLCCVFTLPDDAGHLTPTPLEGDVLIERRVAPRCYYVSLSEP